MSEKIFLCAKSLFNISNDLRDEGLDFLANLSLFLADNVLALVEGGVEGVEGGETTCRGHSNDGPCNGHRNIDNSKSVLKKMPKTERDKVEKEVMDFIEEIRKDDSEQGSS